MRRGCLPACGGTPHTHTHTHTHSFVSPELLDRHTAAGRTELLFEGELPAALGALSACETAGFGAQVVAGFADLATYCAASCFDAGACAAASRACVVICGKGC